MARRKEPAPARDCIYCGTSFRPMKADGRYCSQLCAARQRSRDRLCPIEVPAPDSHDLAWAAGFFDGEGCFLASPGTKYDTSEGPKSRRYLRLTVTQRYEPLLKKLQDIFGAGRVYAQKERPTSSAGFAWTCNGRAAFFVADQMWPWLGEQKKADFKRALRAVRGSRTDFVRQPQHGRVLVAVRKEL